MSAIPSLMIARNPLLTAVSIVATLDKTSVFDSATERSDGGSRTLKTSSVRCDVVGGSGNYTFQWIRVSGSTRIDAGFPSQDATYFSSSMSSPTTRSAVFECRVTDTSTNKFTISNRVSVTLTLRELVIEPEPEPEPEPTPEPEPEPEPITAVSVFPSSRSASGKPPTGQSLLLTTVDAGSLITGGSRNFKYSWFRVSGSSAISINGKQSPSASFSVSSSVAASISGVFSLQVTDVSTGQVVNSSNNVSVSFTFEEPDPVNPPLQSVVVNNTAAMGVGVGSKSDILDIVTRNSVTAAPNPSNAANLSYRWRRTAGNPSIMANTPNSSTTVFRIRTNGGVHEENANFVCDVTDAANGITKTSATVTVSFFIEDAFA